MLLNLGILKYFKWHTFHLWPNNPVYNAGSNSVLGFSREQALIVSPGQSGLGAKQRNAAGQSQKQLFPDLCDKVGKETIITRSSFRKGIWSPPQCFTVLDYLLWTV